LDKIKFKQIVLILILFFVVIFIFLNNQDIDFYENYNRAIPEPDSVKALDFK
tara:strand:+ start:96 stop:251 length:156 start_codon:yes stop_codon:yes gene_type:complete